MYFGYYNTVFLQYTIIKDFNQSKFTKYMYDSSWINDNKVRLKVDFLGNSP